MIMCRANAVAILLLFAMAATIRAQDATDRLYMQAHEAENAGKFPLAISIWDKVIAGNPSDETAWFNRGAVHDRNNEPDKALADYTEALGLDPSDADAYASRASIYLEKKDRDKAFDDYASMVRVRPDVKSYETRASAFRQLHDYKSAILDYNELVRLEPDLDRYYSYRGYTYSVLGEWDKAFDDYDHIIAMEPNSFAGYQYRGEAYSRKGDFEKAIADFDVMLKLEPNQVYLYGLRARAYLHTGDYDKALADADATTRLATDWVPSLIVRGDVYAATGKYDKAAEQYNYVITRQPGNWGGYNSLAWFYATCPKDEVRNGAKAMELAEKACELSQWNDPPCIDTLAAAYAESGKWDEAVKFQKMAVETGKSRESPEWEMKQFISRVALYEQQKPYREIPAPPRENKP